jgi:hypothetical protein
VCRPLQTPVADEIAQIAREALRTAFAHAHAYGADSASSR